MTQNEKVLNYMERFGSITQLEALSDLGIMRLASRINDLKKQGHSVKKEMVKSKNRFGENIQFARYSLEGTGMIVAKTRMNEIPQYCCECELLGDDAGLFGQYEPYDCCGATSKRINDIFLKPDWCPLVELKCDKLE